MPVVSIQIPQLGEGLVEALLVRHLKQPGDHVRRDEPLYEMETDKAATEIESPYDGTLVQWAAQEGAVLPIGATVATVEVAEDVPAAPADSAPAPTPSATAGGALRNRDLPPRTRRYLKQKGLLQSAHLIPAKSGKLTPQDVDAYLSARETAAGEPLPPFDEALLPQRQRTLNFRLARSARIVVPASLATEVDWSAVDAAQAKLHTEHGDSAPSSLTLVLWAIARAMGNHAVFRSTLAADGAAQRTYRRVNLGIAVAQQDHSLVTAVVTGADQLDWVDFVATVRRQIDLARQGTNQATASTTLIVSNIGSLGMHRGESVVVWPAVAALTLGKTFLHPSPAEGGFRFAKMATLTLSFDHRVVNGSAAASFLNEIKQRIEHFELPS